MKLGYDDRGEGLPILLLHGFPLGRWMWSAQLEALSDQGCRLIAPDLRGYGESTVTDGELPEALTMEIFARDAVELLDDLGIREPVVVAGLSMGGYIAQAIAADDPNRVRALILMDTKAKGDSPEAAANREVMAKKVLEANSPEPLVTDMIPKLFSENAPASEPELITQVRGLMMKTPAKVVAATLRGLAIRPDRTHDLPNFSWPTLVIVGADDVITPLSEAREMVGMLPNGTLSVASNAGHLAPMEARNAVDRAILEFLQHSGLLSPKGADPQ